MSDNFAKHVTINSIIADAKEFKNDSYASYHTTYLEFVNYFASLERLEEHNVIIGIHAVYGWMPKILKLDSSQIDQVVQILNQVKTGTDLNLNQLEILLNCFNRSMVGTSKILHFLDPEKYAIWDSKVCRYFDVKTYNYIVNDPQIYLRYLKHCQEIIRQSEYEECHKLIVSKVGYDMTRLRTLEMIMFHKIYQQDGQEQKKKKKAKNNSGE